MTPTARKKLRQQKRTYHALHKYDKYTRLVDMRKFGPLVHSGVAFLDSEGIFSGGESVEYVIRFVFPRQHVVAELGLSAEAELKTKKVSALIRKEVGRSLTDEKHLQLFLNQLPTE